MSHPHNPNYSCSSHSILFLITSVRTHPSLHYYSSDLDPTYASLSSPPQPDQPSSAAHFTTFLISVWSFNFSPSSPPPLTWSPHHFCMFLTWPACHHSDAHWSFSLPPRFPLSAHLIMFSPAWISSWLPLCKDEGIYLDPLAAPNGTHTEPNNSWRHQAPWHPRPSSSARLIPPSHLMLTFFPGISCPAAGCLSSHPLPPFLQGSDSSWGVPEKSVGYPLLARIIMQCHSLAAWLPSTLDCILPKGTDQITLTFQLAAPRTVQASNRNSIIHSNEWINEWIKCGSVNIQPKLVSSSLNSLLLPH